MANPNILQATTVLGKIVGAALSTTLTTSLLANSASSGKVYKIQSIHVANIDGSNNVDITIDVYDGVTAYKLASTVNVPADSTLVVTDRSTAFYLEEGWSIRGGAAVASDAEIVISYEEIS